MKKTIVLMVAAMLLLQVAIASSAKTKSITVTGWIQVETADVQILRRVAAAANLARSFKAGSRASATPRRVCDDSCL